MIILAWRQPSGSAVAITNSQLKFSVSEWPYRPSGIRTTYEADKDLTSFCCSLAYKVASSGLVPASYTSAYKLTHSQMQTIHKEVQVGACWILIIIIQLVLLKSSYPENLTHRIGDWICSLCGFKLSTRCPNPAPYEVLDSSDLTI